MQNCFHSSNNFFVSRQAPGTHHSAREISFVRLDDVHAALFQQRNVRARGRMIPHVHVHRGSYDYRRSGGQIQSAQKIVRDAAREFRDDVRGGGNYQQQIGALRHGNVFDRAFEISFVSEELPNKSVITFCPVNAAKVSGVMNSRAPAGHDHFDGESVLLQQAHQFGGLVGRDSSGHTHRDSHGVPWQRALLAALVAVLVLVDGIRLHEIVLEQTVIQFFARRCAWLSAFSDFPPAAVRRP